MSDRKTEWLVWGALLLTICALLLGFALHSPAAKPLPVLGTMSDFVLTNQDNQAVTLAALHGDVWLADVIFTRCPGQCPIMSSHMQEIQNRLPPGSPIRLVSFTTDPGYDTPSILKKYAAKYEARDGQWLFLTGAKSALRQATVNGLKLGVVDKPAADRDSETDLFIHSEKIVLIDQEGSIRGYYDGQTSEGAAAALADAQTLGSR